MKAFVDTSAWYALADKRDQHHREAVEILGRLRENCLLVTTDYVIDETVTIIRFRLSHSASVDFLDRIHRSKSVKVVFTSREMFQQAEEIFRRYSDKHWSMTDCVSFAVMNKLRLSDAFAFDRHFTEYGQKPLRGG